MRSSWRFAGSYGLTAPAAASRAILVCIVPFLLLYTICGVSRTARWPDACPVPCGVRGGIHGFGFVFLQADLGLYVGDEAVLQVQGHHVVASLSRCTSLSGESSTISMVLDVLALDQDASSLRFQAEVVQDPRAPAWPCGRGQGIRVWCGQPWLARGSPLPDAGPEPRAAGL